jgi:hypothetical protein
MNLEDHKADRKFLCQDRKAVKAFSVSSLGRESAAAVVTFVRAIYGFPLPSAPDLLWASWFDIAVYAPKYLPPEVGEEAAQKFLTSCLQQTDSEEVVKILQKLDHHNHPAKTLDVEKIRKHHELKLLRNEKYRATLRLSDRETLMQHIDNLLDMLEQGSEAS